MRCVPFVLLLARFSSHLLLQFWRSQQEERRPKQSEKRTRADIPRQFYRVRDRLLLKGIQIPPRGFYSLPNALGMGRGWAAFLQGQETQCQNVGERHQSPMW